MGEGGYKSLQYETKSLLKFGGGVGEGGGGSLTQKGLMEGIWGILWKNKTLCPVLLASKSP